jgi:hypothetical protein
VSLEAITTEQGFAMTTSRGRAAPVNSKRSRVAFAPLEPAEKAFDARCRETLSLWLQWNEAYENATQAMCRPGQTQEQLESLMDDMDQLRRRAIATSRELLG